MILAGKEVQDWTGKPISVDVARRQKRKGHAMRLRHRWFGWFSTEGGRSRAEVVFAGISALVGIMGLVLVLWPVIQGWVSQGGARTPVPTAAVAPIPTATPLAGTPGAPDEILVVVARFDGDDGYNIQRYVSTAIESEVTELNVGNVRVIEANEVISADQEDLVQQMGDVYNATAVIWGWIDKSGFTPNFTITRVPQAFPILRLQQQGTLPEEKFQTYVRERLPAQMAYFVAWTVSQILFWTGEIDQAAVMLDQALEQAQKGDTTLGLEHVYLYRGIIEQEFRGNPDQALIEYSHGIDLNPDWGVLYNNRGGIYEDAYRYQDALKDYQLAIEKGFPAYAYNNRCIVYMDLGDYDQALKDCNQAIALQEPNPSASSPYLNRGSVYVQLGDFSHAKADYQAAIEHDPQNADAYCALAELYERHLGDPDQALAGYMQALAVDPSLSKAHVRIGRIYEDRGNEQQALQEYTDAVTSDPSDVDAYWARASLYADLGQADEAFADFVKLLLLEPGEHVAFELCEGLHRCDEAVGQLHDLVEDLEAKKQDTRPAHVALGHLYEENGDLEKSLREFSIALAQSSTFEIYCSRAAVHRKAQNLQAALDDYSSAIDLRPDAWFTRSELADVYEELGELDKALQERIEVVRLRPRVEFSYSELYELCERMQACENVIAELVAESTTASFDPDVYLILAQLSEEMGRYEDAINYNTDFLELDPDDLWVREKRANQYEHVSRLDKALEDYSFVLLHRPRATEIYMSRARVYRQQGDYELALDDYNTAALIDPTDWMTLSARASVYDELGQVALATADYVAIVSMRTYVSSFDTDRLVEYCQEHGSCQQAIEELSSIAVDSSSPSPSAYYARARLYEETNQLTEAAEDYTVLVEELGFPEGYYHRGVIYKDLGEIELALQDFEEYLRADPSTTKRADVEKAIAELTQ